MLDKLVANWLTSTPRQGVPVLGSAKVASRLGRLKEPSVDSAAFAFSHGSDAEALTVLSALAAEMLGTDIPSARILADAAAAFDTLLKRDLLSDSFGEANELRGLFAFLAWRHSRALGDLVASNEWVEKYDEVACHSSVEHDSAEEFLSRCCDTPASLAGSAFLENEPTVFLICSMLREKRNLAPRIAGPLAERLFGWMADVPTNSNFADERAYFRGQFALTAAACRRLTGRRSEALAWIECAEFWHARTIDSRSGELDSLLLRLLLRFEEGFCSEVIEALPQLQRELTARGMKTSLAKSKFLESQALKNLGHFDQSIAPLHDVVTLNPLDPGIRSFVAASLTESYAVIGEIPKADSFLRMAMTELAVAERPLTRAFLKVVVGEQWRTSGDLHKALQAYREGQRDYESLGVSRWAIYAQILIAEVLLALNRTAEAEEEIRATFPVIESLQMVPEGFAALALLRESVRRRATDRNALQELKDYLKRSRS